MNRRIFAFALTFLLPASAYAQQNRAETRPVLSASGAFFALSVADLAASTDWYTQKLGLRVVMQPPPQGGSAMTLLQGGGLTVELIQRDDARPLREAAPQVRGALFLHGIFKVGAVIDNYEQALATLRARQVDIAIGPFPARADQPANVIIRDNAGNYIQLISK